MPDDNDDGLTKEEFEEAYEIGQEQGKKAGKLLADTILGKDTKPEDMKERENFIKSMVSFMTKTTIRYFATEKKAENFEERLKNERENESDERTR